MPLVSGFIELPDAGEALRSAWVHVRVEDVSRVDAPARLLGEWILEGIPEDQIQAGLLPFELEVADPGEAAMCAIRAHLDLDRDGVVGACDYVSTEHIPVQVGAAAAPVRVSVGRVGRR